MYVGCGVFEFICVGLSWVPTWILGFSEVNAQRLLSSSFMGLPYRILNMSHKKELLRILWVWLGSVSATKIS